MYNLCFNYIQQNLYSKVHIDTNPTALSVWLNVFKNYCKSLGPLKIWGMCWTINLNNKNEQISLVWFESLSLYFYLDVSHVCTPTFKFGPCCHYTTLLCYLILGVLLLGTWKLMSFLRMILRYRLHTVHKRSEKAVPSSLGCGFPYHFRQPIPPLSCGTVIFMHTLSSGFYVNVCMQVYMLWDCRMGRWHASL